MEIRSNKFGWEFGCLEDEQRPLLVFAHIPPKIPQNLPCLETGIRFKVSGDIIFGIGKDVDFAKMRNYPMEGHLPTRLPLFFKSLIMNNLNCSN